VCCVQTTFARFDRDRGGTIDARELNEAIHSYGYRLTPQTLNAVVKRYASRTNSIDFDDFVALSIRLRGISAGYVGLVRVSCSFV
jgi:Ca2+-binding EF-hand superfamily protein